MKADYPNVRLRYIAQYQNSNVDKKTKDGEVPVQLCNYTDVYYNETIVAGKTDFMRATAKPEQIAQLSLETGDVLMTKDSESPDDIGVPAWVPESIDGLVCAYHLTRIRPNDDVSGSYLFRVLQSDAAKAHWVKSATGVTRFGLNLDAIGNLPIPLPSFKKQTSIANYLDRETARIDALIAKKQRLIELLKEKRQAVITQAVTKGLNPNAAMKDSGVEWLGEIPAHWIAARVKRVANFVTSGPRGWSDLITESGNSLFLQSGELNDNLCIEFGRAQKINISSDGAEAERCRLNQGDTLVCITGAKTGRVAFAATVPKYTYVNQHLSLIRVAKEAYCGRFMAQSLSSELGRSQFRLYQYGLKEGLSLADVKNTYIAKPPVEEQNEISKWLLDKVGLIDTSVDTVIESIELLKERRAALITAAVTGQLEINEAA